MAQPAIFPYRVTIAILGLEASRNRTLFDVIHLLGQMESPPTEFFGPESTLKSVGILNGNFPTSPLPIEGFEYLVRIEWGELTVILYTSAMFEAFKRALSRRSPLAISEFQKFAAVSSAFQKAAAARLEYEKLVGELA